MNTKQKPILAKIVLKSIKVQTPTAERDVAFNFGNEEQFIFDEIIADAAGILTGSITVLLTNSDDIVDPESAFDFIDYIIAVDIACRVDVKQGIINFPKKTMKLLSVESHRCISLGYGSPEFLRIKEFVDASKIKEFEVTTHFSID